MPGTVPGRERRRRRRAGRLAMAALILLIGGALIGRAALAPPSWYAPPDTGADAPATMTAERFEYRFVEELQRVRAPGATWTVRIEDEHLNAWLAARLPAWASRVDPEAVDVLAGAVQLETRGDGVEVAIPIRRAGVRATAIVSLSVDAAADGSGADTIRVDAVRLGRGGLSARWLGRTGQQARASLEREIADFADGGVIELPDGRHVELAGIAFESGSSAITFRTPVRFVGDDSAR